MPSRFRLSVLLWSASLAALAQPGCPPLSFQSAIPIYLTTPGGSHFDLLRETDGSYTAYELADLAPYRVIRTTQDFQKQLTVCPPGPPVAGLSPEIGPVQVFARTPSGGYLFVQTPGAFSTPPNSQGIDVAEFDSRLSLLSEVQFPIYAQAIAIADLNGDGIPDIVIGTVASNGPASLEVLLGKGGVSFQPPVDYPIAGSVNVQSDIQSLTVGDLNGDHKLDVAIASDFPTNKISIFFGNGDGTFQNEAIPFTLPANVNNLFALATADLNGDGKADLVFTVHDQTSIPHAMVALATGGGAFAAPVLYAVGGTRSVAIADMNGDGIPDIVTSGVSILYGDGTGSFPTRRDYLVDTAGSVILTDFDGDGKMDVVVGAGNPDLLTGTALAVLLGRGDETFAGPPVSAVPGIPAPDALFTALSSGYFNHDGIPDLVSSDNLGDIDFLQGAGDGSFRPVFEYGVLADGQVPSGIVTADFNHDGKLDFAVVRSAYISSGAGYVDIFLGNGDGTFRSPLKTPAPLGAFALTAADFNGDGIVDLAVLVSQEGTAPADSVAVWLGNGDGTFHSSASYPAGPFAHAIAASDLNGDGRLDLVITNAGTYSNQNRDGNIELLFGKGDGTFASAPAIPLTGGNVRGPYGLAVADFNADGKPDLAITLSDYSNYEGGLVILLGRGDGTFQPPIPCSFSAVGVLTGDLNGDGIPDLIVTGSGTSPGTGYLLGVGDGTFQPEINVALYLTPVAIGDFNGDGRLDIAGGTLPGGIATFLNISHTPPALSIVSAATFASGPLAPGSLATAFGKNLATSAGATVSIQDSTGASRMASLLYVSPRQINFLVPAATAPGPATVTFTPALGPPSQLLSVQIAPVAPALFSVGAIAAAYAVFVTPDGAQTLEPVFTEQNGTAIPVPVSLGSPSDQTFLILYGTGIRGAQSSVTVTIQGVTAPVVYSGAQPQFPGLDQINVRIPPSLAGSGLVSVALSAAGIPANIVNFAIQ